MKVIYLQFKKTLWYFLVQIILLLPLWAQQEAGFTHYMESPIIINPAYAGTRGSISFTGIYRKQWINMNGAPTTVNFSLHSPFSNETMGVGVSFLQDKIGPQQNSIFTVDYSYHLQVSTFSKLSLGLKVGFELMSLNISDLQIKDNADPHIYDIKNAFLPDVGIGIFYYSGQGYLGLGIPNILEPKWSKNTVSGLDKWNKHYYLMGGIVFELGKYTDFKPSILIRGVKGAPLTVDINGMFYFVKRFGVGISYRKGDSFSGILHVYALKNFKIGYAYDYTFSDLHDNVGGTHEFIISYDIGVDQTRRIYSPRFF